MAVGDNKHVCTHFSPLFFPYSSFFQYDSEREKEPSFHRIPKHGKNNVFFLFSYVFYQYVSNDQNVYNTIVVTSKEDTKVGCEESEEEWEILRIRERKRTENRKNNMCVEGIGCGFRKNNQIE